MSTIRNIVKEEETSISTRMGELATMMEERGTEFVQSVNEWVKTQTGMTLHTLLSCNEESLPKNEEGETITKEAVLDALLSRVRRGLPLGDVPAGQVGTDAEKPEVPAATPAEEDPEEEPEEEAEVKVTKTAADLLGGNGSGNGKGKAPKPKPAGVDAAVEAFRKALLNDGGGLSEEQVREIVRDELKSFIRAQALALQAYHNQLES